MMTYGSSVRNTGVGARRYRPKIIQITIDTSDLVLVPTGSDVLLDPSGIRFSQERSAAPSYQASFDSETSSRVLTQDIR